MQTNGSYRGQGGFTVGVDVGGTFTDVCVHDAAGRRLGTAKRLSTAPDPSAGLRASLRAAAADLGMTLPEVLARTALVTYGTTVATNAVVTRSTAPIGLLCTAGFRDILWIREGGKDDPFDWKLDYPPPFVPRRLVRPVAGRLSAEGEELEPLCEDDVRRAVDRLVQEGVAAIAVSYLWSFVNPDHELRTAELVRELWPDASLVLSHQIDPAPREYRRTIATAIDASLGPVVKPHLDAVERLLLAEGLAGELLVVSSRGGILPLEEMRERPILSVGSGPTMTPVAARRAATGAGWPTRTLLVGDMGGTSFDVSLVHEDRVRFSRDIRVGADLLGIARVAIQSIGAGGGSIVWVDEGGMLRVGPESAGADPGPACYGRAGVAARPTVTDANLVLGRLDPGGRLGDGLALDIGAAEAAFAPLASQLSRSVVEVADIACATVNQAMVNEIESIATLEGVDPAGTLFVAGGGACGLHAAEIARELGIRQLLLPRHGGTLSAYGALVADVSHEFSTARHMRSDAVDVAELRALVERLTRSATDFLGRAEREPASWKLTGTCEARYVGQIWELDVPLPSLEIDEETVIELTTAFHDLHERVYGVAQPDEAVEFLLWRVRGASATPSLDVAPDRTAARQPSGERAVYVGDGFRRVPVWPLEGVGPAPLGGPAIVAGRSTTYYVPPAWSMAALPSGDYLMTADA